MATMTDPLPDFVGTPRLSPLSVRVVLITILALAILSVFRLIVLYMTPLQLFFDEAQYWSWGLEPDFGYFSKPPLLAWIIRATTEVCGTGEACIRAASPLLYAGTALLAGFLAHRVASRNGVSGAHAFFWTAVLFATLPGVTFGARLISTDAPLLFCFAAGLLVVDFMRERVTMFRAVLLGLAIGTGLMAKYAMVYFLISLLLWGVFTQDGRKLLAQFRFWLFLPLAVLCVLPNILWNAERDWITFQHTRDNGNWQGLTLHFDNMIEFAGAQIGILGPILFLAIVIALFRKRQALGSDMAFLLYFAVPVQVLMIAQATISRAHANWAAVSFIALCVLAVCLLVQWRARLLLMVTACLHIAVLGVLSFADMRADTIVTSSFGNAYKRLFGWRELADAVDEVAMREGVKVVLAERRSVVAQFSYHLRDSNYKLRTWPPAGRPFHHYEMSIPLTPADEGPVLIAASCPPGQERADIQALPEIVVPVRHNATHRIYPYVTLAAEITRTDVCG